MLGHIVNLISTLWLIQKIQIYNHTRPMTWKCLLHNRLVLVWQKNNYTNSTEKGLVRKFPLKMKYILIPHGIVGL